MRTLVRWIAAHLLALHVLQKKGQPSPSGDLRQRVLFWVIVLCCESWWTVAFSFARPWLVFAAFTTFLTAVFVVAPALTVALLVFSRFADVSDSLAVGVFCGGVAFVVERAKHPASWLVFMAYVLAGSDDFRNWLKRGSKSVSSVLTDIQAGALRRDVKEAA